MKYFRDSVLPSSVSDREQFLDGFRRWPQVSGEAGYASGESSLWTGGLDQELLWRLAGETEERACAVIARVEGSRYWPRAVTWGQSCFERLLAHCAALGGFAGDIRLWASDDLDDLARAAFVYTIVLDVICDRQYPVTTGGTMASVQPPEPLRQWVGEGRQTAHQVAVDLLGDVGAPLDAWHREVVIARLLCPRLALFALSYPFWLDPPPAGLTDLERQAATAVGSPEGVERAAFRVKKAMQRELGHDTAGRKRGAKAGKKRRPSEAQVARDQYLKARVAAGVSPQLVAEDGEANRLHQAARRDHTAKLSESIVRRVVRGG